jgi:alkylhydroperoxidase family enzyme
MVRDWSYRITDSDLDELAASGLSDDASFEITVAAAVGAALQRLTAGMRAIRGMA